MKNRFKEFHFVKVIQKTIVYNRLRAHLPGGKAQVIDDRRQLDPGDAVKIDWLRGVPKPRVAVIRDLEPYPRWTKYIHFLESNGFPYGIYDLHAHDWLEQASRYDVFVGLISCDLAILTEMRRKYFILEHFLGKVCYPSAEHIFLYEDKGLEAYIAEIDGIPFARAHISHDEADALRMIQTLRYPVISKFETSSGSVGVQMVRNRRQAEKIVRQSFSVSGRATHMLYRREKNTCYFQDFIPNDGYDIRCIVVDHMVFGYKRRVLDGDFRASGMNQVVWDPLPEEAILTAWRAYHLLKSPMLVMDMLHGLDGRYYVIEYSINCQIDTPEQLIVNGVPGAYVVDENECIRFQPCRYWIHDLALRQFFLEDYLPRFVAARRAEPIDEALMLVTYKETGS